MQFSTIPNIRQSTPSTELIDAMITFFKKDPRHWCRRHRLGPAYCLLGYTYHQKAWKLRRLIRRAIREETGRHYRRLIFPFITSISKFNDAKGTNYDLILRVLYRMRAITMNNATAGKQ